MPKQGSLLRSKGKRLNGDSYKFLMKKVFERDRWTCRNPFCESYRNLTIHHIIKRSQGGGDELGNLITLCLDCHEKIERHELELEVVDVVVKFFQKGG